MSLTLSTLLRASTVGRLVSASRSRIRRSPSGKAAAAGEKALVSGCASTTSKAASTWSMVAIASRTMKRFSSERASCTPGVSTNTICPFTGPCPARGSVAGNSASPFHTPTMRVRVVCGLGVTMASFSPTIRLSRVDLPTLGLPRMATVPATLSAAWPVKDGALGSGMSDTGTVV